MTNRQTILAYLRDHGRGTAFAIADATGRDARSVRNMLRLLALSGHVIAVGTLDPTPGMGRPHIVYALCRTLQPVRLIRSAASQKTMQDIALRSRNQLEVAWANHHHKGPQ